MDDWQIKLITRILAISIAAGGGALGVHKYYAEEIKNISAESQHRLDQLHSANSKINNLETDLSTLSHEHDSLKQTYQILQADYEKATTTNGLIYDGPSMSSSWQEANFSTGDSIRFKLASVSLYINIVRVTDDGPIVRASGCTPQLVDHSFVSESDGPMAYCLFPNKELHLQVSGKGSSQGYITSDLSDLEDVIIICKSFDVKEQQASIRFRKLLIGS